jgi:predicted DNA-binding transcriptional regulator YafY
MDRTKFKPKFNRILFIDRKIREGSYPNAVDLAGEYEGISSRTIKRDIEWLRDFHNAPIAYSPEYRGYYYTEPNFRLPAITISGSELFYTAVAEQVLKQYRNTPVYAQLKKVFKKLASLVPDKVTMEVDWVDSRLTICEIPIPKIDETIWKDVIRALREERMVQFSYKAPSHKKRIDRTIAPYHAVCHRSQWYLLGHDHYRNEVRIFALSRMSDVKLLKTRFEIPDDFSINNYIDPGIGVFMNDKTYQVELVIAAEVGGFFTERQWHEKQELKQLSGGKLRLSFPTNQLEEVMYFVLGWGEHIIVENPPELVEMIKERLSRTLRKYGV